MRQTNGAEKGKCRPGSSTVSESLESRNRNSSSEMSNWKTSSNGAPQDRVPHEILETVFRLCDTLPIQLPPRFTRPQAIWSILQVCSRWRRIAISDPIIWGQLEIKSMSVAWKGKLEILDDIIHEIFANRGGDGIVEYHALMTDAEWDRMATLMRVYPHRLRKLNIRSPRPYQTEYIKDTFSVSSNPSNTIAVSNYNSSSWGHLTHLAIDSIDLPTLCYILSHCKQLVDLKVIFVKTTITHFASQKPIKLSSLRSILIKQDGGVLVGDFLDVLVLPSLEHLKFGFLTVWPQKSLLSLITRSGFTLKTLETNQTHIVLNDILSLEEVIPGLSVRSSQRSPGLLNGTVNL